MQKKDKTLVYSNVTIPSSQFTSGGISVRGGSSYTLTDKSMTAGTTSIQSALRVNGDANIDGDLTVKGRSIIQSLEKIEERLAILPPPNPDLEQDWEQLAQLRQQYVELERQLLEKQQVFDILKKSY
jgi:hypothetical protein